MLLTKEAMEKLNTKRLLAYKASLLKVHDLPNWDNDGELSKQSPEWIAAYDACKAILNTREHVA